MRIPNSQALEIIEESIKSGNPVKIRVRGNSMNPALIDGIDYVTLYPFEPDSLRVGEVVLFRYGNSFIMHRIVKISKDDKGHPLITARGDALSSVERITLADIVAVARLPRHSPLMLTVRGMRLFLRRIAASLYRRIVWNTKNC